MSIKIGVRQVGKTTVVDIAGRVTLLGEGEEIGGSAKLRDKLHELLAEGRDNIILNLSEVSYIDSSGIGELVSGFTTITNGGGRIKLLNLNKRVRNLLHVTNLHTVFDVYEDETSAISSFS